MAARCMPRRGHPTADGRLLGQVRVGDVVDGAIVVRAELAAYGGGQTFDLMPSGGTGFYIADGVAVASTLGTVFAAQLQAVDESHMGMSGIGVAQVGV